MIFVVGPSHPDEFARELAETRRWAEGALGLVMKPYQERWAAVLAEFDKMQVNAVIRQAEEAVR